MVVEVATEVVMVMVAVVVEVLVHCSGRVEVAW